MNANKLTNNGTTDEDRITTLEPGRMPTAASLIAEIKEAIVAASAQGIFIRLSFCHNVRRCLEAGRNVLSDGRLTGEKLEGEKTVWRWKGAPDLNVHLTDKIIRRLMLMRSQVVTSGDVRVAPRRGNVSDTDQDLSEVWQNTMDYFLDVGDGHVSCQSDLFSTTVEELGYGIQLVEVVKKVRNEVCQVNLQQITNAMVKQLEEEQMAAMQAGAEDPDADEDAGMEGLEAPGEEEQEIGERVAAMLETMMAGRGRPSDDELAMVKRVDARMTDEWAARVVKALREDPTAEVEYAAPKDDGCTFRLETLVPWINCIHPYLMDGEGMTDMVAVVRYYNEPKLREKALVEKWDKAATKDLVKNHKNEFFTNLFAGQQLPEWSLNGMGVGMVVNQNALKEYPHWLVLYVYRKITNAEGRPVVYRGALNPNMPDKLLMWEMTDLEELPIVVDTCEPVRFAMDARGVPMIVVDKQNFVKDSLNNEGARAQLGSNPPLNRTAGQHVGISPGKELYAKRSGTSFEGSEFMQVPVVDQGTLAMMDRVERLVEDYYFASEVTDPEDKRAFRRWKMLRAKFCYAKALRLLWRQMQETIDVLQVSNINGRPVNLDARRDQLQGEAAISIGVHLDGLTEDAADKFVKVFTQLSQSDRGGVIDNAEGMRIAAQLLVPTFARRLVMTNQAASDKIVDDEEGRIAKIMAGVPMRYDERASNPGLRLQTLQQWAALPENVARASTDPVVMGLMQKEEQWLRFQIQQQSVNATTGRTGVTPNEPPGAGG